MEGNGGPAYESLEACVLQDMGRWTVPGIAVGVLQDGRVEAHGFGVASLETRQPVTADTLFQVGSITKVYTATLIMRLVEDGTLDLDTPVIEYLPELQLADQEARRAITLRHLLSHTSGLEGDRFDDYGMGDDALTQAIAEFQTLRQLFPPGELWTYCNAGFYLAGAVVERVTGRPFETVMRERLFEPLGVARTFFFAHEAIAYPVAVGHEQPRPETAPTVARRYPLPRAINAAGGIIATVGDLLRFAELHLREGKIDGARLLSEASVRAMQSSQTPAANFADAYGLGWALRTIGVVQVVGHGGSTNGFRAHLTLVPGTGFALALLTNGARGSAATRAIEAWALGRYRGLVQAEPPIVTLPTNDLAAFAGRYKQPLASLTIAEQDGALRVETVAHNPWTKQDEPIPPFTMAPIGPRDFRVLDGDAAGAKVDFLPAQEGKPLRVRIGGRLADRID